MRVARKEIKDKNILIRLLSEAYVGRLATNRHDGYPVIKPLNFLYDEGKIYIHSAQEGEKIEDIKQDNRVCFEVDFPISYVKTSGSPCKAAYRYRSVIMKGRAFILEDRQEKIRALKGLMEKYQPEGGYGKIPDEKLDLTAVVRIDVEEMTGKEDVGR
ncbi:MAG TPA: pyridoxamine 5'-phosphate oxidase family protein [Syntrophorhabdaceae bacterium]|nr:pyridoxamine 5'-phosphate oxidase family protein [Syntrophorhabdaceae bacterium]